jgi:hypothetical protein
VETRELLSVTALIATSRPSLPVPGLTRLEQFPPVYQSQTPNLTGGAAGQPPLATGNNPFVIASGTFDGTPTRHELARNQFAAKFAGSYELSPGRTNELATTTRLEGNGSWTNILHGEILAVIATPVAGSSLPAVGIVELNARNDSVTGQLILRAQAAPGDTSLPAPSHYTWVVDPSSSGGYTNALGQGTLDVHYLPTSLSRSARGLSGAGKIFVVIKGDLVTSGLNF